LWVLVRLLRPEDFVAFACDCAERVLHLFENKFPNDDRPRKAIEAARSGDKAAAWDASDAAGDASWDVRDSAWDAAGAARAASFAAGAAGAVKGAAGRAVAAEAAADGAVDAASTANAEGAAEQDCQLNRVLELVHGAEQSGHQPF